MYSGPFPCYCNFSFQSRRDVVGGDERWGGADRNERKGMGRWMKRNKNYEQ